MVTCDLGDLPLQLCFGGAAGGGHTLGVKSAEFWRSAVRVTGAQSGGVSLAPRAGTSCAPVPLPVWRCGGCAHVAFPDVTPEKPLFTAAGVSLVADYGHDPCLNGR